MKKTEARKKVHVNKAIKENKDNPPGYPLYPSGEDIYIKFQEEKDLDPEEISKIKASNTDDKKGLGHNEDLPDDIYDIDLDVPGSELDDTQENIGSEDEENNYYSLGGDDHNDLDEDEGK